MTKQNHVWRLILAWKYITSPRNRQRSALMLSVLGLALGLMIIVVVISIMQGLQEGYLRDIIEVDAYHMTVGPVAEDEIEQLRADIAEGIPHRALVSFGESEMLLVQDDGRNASLKLRGLDPSYQDDQGFFQQARAVRGSFTLEHDGAVIGSDLAAREGISVGDTIKVATVVRGSRVVRAVPSVRYLEVTGIFSTGYPDIDSSLGFTTLETVREMGIRQYFVGIKTDNLSQLEAQLAEYPPVSEIQRVSWQKAYETLYAALLLEKYSMMVVLMLIFIVVAINIKSSFERFLFEKKHEIGIMKTLGASAADIRMILMYQAVFLAAAAMVPGLILGVLLASNVNPVLHGIDRLLQLLFSQGIGIAGIRFPVIISWPDIWVSAGVMVLFLLLAVLRSARIIRRFTPMEMFRYE